MKAKDKKAETTEDSKPEESSATKEQVSDPVLAAAQAAAADPSLLISRLDQLLREMEVLRKENAELRKISMPSEGGRRLVRGELETDFEMPVDEDPLPITDVAVFRSNYAGFKQVLKRGYRHRDSPDQELEPPVIAEFDRGVCVLRDPELIEIMRKKMAEKFRKRQYDFVEVEGTEPKRAALAGTRHIVSGTVTPDTPLEDVIQ